MLSCAYWKSLLYIWSTARPSRTLILVYFKAVLRMHKIVQFFGFFNAEEPKSHENQFLRLLQTWCALNRNCGVIKCCIKRTINLKEFSCGFLHSQSCNRNITFSSTHIAPRQVTFYQLQYNCEQNQTILLNIKNGILHPPYPANFNIVRRHLWMWNFSALSLSGFCSVLYSFYNTATKLISRLDYVEHHHLRAWLWNFKRTS